MSKEEWEDIKGYEGIYKISNLGKVKSLERVTKIPNSYRKEKEKILKASVRSGYYVVNLRKNNIRKSYQIHRLVAQAFIPNPENKSYVNHIDFNKKNNNVSNLEWCTQKENVQWSICNMKHRKNITHSNTGEKYITYRKNTNTYRLTIDKREYNYKTIEEAIKKKEEIINEKI